MTNLFSLFNVAGRRPWEFNFENAFYDPIRYSLFMNDRDILFCNDIGLYAVVCSLFFCRVINVTVIDGLASMYISP